MRQVNWTEKDERKRLEARYSVLGKRYMRLFARLAVLEGVKFPICMWPYTPLAIHNIETCECEWYLPSVRTGITVLGRKIRLLRSRIRMQLWAKTGDRDMQWWWRMHGWRMPLGYCVSV